MLSQMVCLSLLNNWYLTIHQAMHTCAPVAKKIRHAHVCINSIQDTKAFCQERLNCFMCMYLNNDYKKRGILQSTKAIFPVCGTMSAHFFWPHYSNVSVQTQRREFADFL